MQRISVTGTNIRSWLKNVVDKEMAALTTDYKSAVVPKTPIDTGRARRGWQTRNNSIKNSVPYIARLEGGYSRQAPSGFVNQAVKDTVNKSKQRKY
jgi:hypothetical protein